MTDATAGGSGSSPTAAQASNPVVPAVPVAHGPATDDPVQTPASGAALSVDPTRKDPALGKTTDEYKSWQAKAVGAYIFVLAFALIHLIAVIWPPPVVSRDVIDTLEREEQLRETRRIEAEDVAGARYVTLPANATIDAAAAWRRDSARAWATAVEAQRMAQLTRQIADSVRERRSRAVLDQSTVQLFWGLITLEGLSLDVRLILLALGVGALGAFVHCAQSFATYVGNRTLALSWSWWYVLRPLIGASLAVFFYFAFRGALFPNSLSISGDISPYGIAALGSLSGMFSKQAVDKLDELFRSLFRTEAQARDNIPKPANPAAGAAGEARADAGGAGGAGVG